MRTLKAAKIANYTLIAHQVLLILLVLSDLVAYISFYLTLTKLTLLLKFRVKLFLSGLPRDLRRSVYSSYKSYLEANLSIWSIRNLLSLISRSY
ncbi:MAG: hypothetical protein QN229_02610 [Desulfurococcaceae archaeon TW002]